MDKMHFPFSDTISGYVTKSDWSKDTFTMKTSDGREFDVKLTPTVYAEVVRNLGEPYIDCTGQIRDLLVSERFLHVYGVFYPEAGTYNFEAKHIVIFDEDVQKFRFEEQDWWVKQITALGDFYLKAEFNDGEVDYSKYQTNLNLEGEEVGDIKRQETDTISRLVYGFATAYLMTGEDRFIEAAEKGTKYLRDHMRCVDENEAAAYWYHAVVLQKDTERKVFASEFGDDYDAIPAYEQIYALAGPTQTLRVTGDVNIAKDIEMTVNFMDKYFLDTEKGGYFSHVDPITFNPRSERLGKNQSRKNWNSVGDHAPAYLINAYLATGSERYKKMLQDTGNTITAHFGDYENSPYVQEKFHEDWSHDSTWGWQQDRGVVGHNLKIAWNLMRLNSIEENEKYVQFAKKIAVEIPKVGYDKQRGGWFDVMERKLHEQEEFHRFVWHDRKAWWQQEQGILAFLILHGILKDEEYLKYARESEAFYNAWFLDTQSGGVYFNVLANGLPYLVGDERSKGSHSMSGYHSFELSYLSQVYTNLLITKKPMDLYFKPYPNSFKDNILPVSPDLLPKGSIKIDKVWIDGKEYKDFDAENLTVKLPESDERLKVKVSLIPTSGIGGFDASIDEKGREIKITLSGAMNSSILASFGNTLKNVVRKNPIKLVFVMEEVTSITHDVAREIVFACQKLEESAVVEIIDANNEIKAAFDALEFSERVKFI
ncbi:N-acylglucosamine 2-epimerase [Clostridium cellulovorans]|uniref:N-acylglucosamine 2-epimerase n=1 Tax=Clostridium cellulovorans (strain ATCC 35296 / DSM 3052 / OCM 3 / 743B) TaxID=573061 RepID=D9SU22_CLOC7|nr:N-acylglucosamine 2-epimerase [Clostridium cellulovorans]ADL50860.1 N-acylglucosamine 2-epimerase [Clostridium cellulovorans 743B]